MGLMGLIWAHGARLGNEFSLAAGACSAEKMLLLQPWRPQREEKFCNAGLGHPFSLVSGACSAKEILTTLNRYRFFCPTKVERHFDTKHFGAPSLACLKFSLHSAAKYFATLDWVTRFLWYLARAARRKFGFCNPGASRAEKISRNAKLESHLSSGIRRAPRGESLAFANLAFLQETQR